MHRMRCAEIWGGIRNQDADVCSAGITAALFSASCDGGKGGDIYFFSVCSTDKLTRLVVADVVGHGKNVSDVSAWLYAELESHMNDVRGDDILKAMNTLACEKGFDAITTAAVVGYYLADGFFYFSYAGHHAAIVRKSQDGTWQAATIDDERDGAMNLPLGVDADGTFSQSRMALSSGDRLFLYTDGVIEAPNASGELFGESRLMAVLRETGSASLLDTKAAVLNAIRDFTGGSLAHDDVTVLAVEVN